MNDPITCLLAALVFFAAALGTLREQERLQAAQERAKADGGLALELRQASAQVLCAGYVLVGLLFAGIAVRLLFLV